MIAVSAPVATEIATGAGVGLDTQVAAVLRAATSADAAAIHALVSAYAEEGHLLPRAVGELTVRAPRFLVAEREGSIVACAELAPIGQGTAEVRSLVVDRGSRDEGLGGQLLQALRQRARIEGYARLCAFTHEPAYFVRFGFSIVPHTWVPEKIATDCHRCPAFRSCGQHAVVLALTSRA